MKLKTIAILGLAFFGLRAFAAGAPHQVCDKWMKCGLYTIDSQLEDGTPVQTRMEIQAQAINSVVFTISRHVQGKDPITLPLIGTFSSDGSYVMKYLESPDELYATGICAGMVCGYTLQPWVPVGEVGVLVDVGVLRFSNDGLDFWRNYGTLDEPRRIITKFKKTN